MADHIEYVTRHCNVQGTDSTDQVQQRIRSVLPGATIVTWNELHRPALRGFVLSLPGWDSVVRGQLGISWRLDVWERAGVGTWEKSHGGVARVTPVRGVLSVPLQYRRGPRLVHWHQVTHGVHRIDWGGRPRRATFPGQLARARTHFATMQASIVAHHQGGLVGTRLVQDAPVLGAGDVNVDYQSDRAAGVDWFPYSMLSQVSRIIVPQEGKATHKGRTIDWGWATDPIRPLACTVLPRGTSDHHPVEFRVRQDDQPKGSPC